MKKLKYTLVLIAFFFAFATVSAQEKTTLYSITGNGLQEPSYLFGTLHMQCPEDFEIKDKIKKAFSTSSQIYFEIDLDDPTEIASYTQALQQTIKISEALTHKEYVALDSLVQRKLGYPLDALDSYGLQAALMVLEKNEFECETQLSYDFKLMEMALEKNLPIYGLEKALFQIECLVKSTDIQTTLKRIFEMNKELTKDMQEAYKMEDLKALADIFQNPNYMTEDAMKWILEVRNTNWLEKMPDIMKNGSTFFAVGAGHLLFDIGLIDGLRNAGYTVTPILR